MKKLMRTLLMAAALPLLADVVPFGQPDESGAPGGWRIYGQNGDLSVQDGVLRLSDRSDADEWGVSCIIPAEGAGHYEATLEAAVPAGVQPPAGARLQLRALPSNQYQQVFLNPLPPNGSFRPFQVGIDAPEGTDRMQLYVFSSRPGCGEYLVRNVTVGKIGEGAAFLNGELSSRNAANVPAGWRQYGNTPLQVRDGLLYIDDDSTEEEAGIVQSIPITSPGRYVATVYSALPDDDADPANAYIQLRVHPQNTYVQEPLDPGPPGEFQPTTVTIEAGEGTRSIDLYIYTHKAATPRFLLQKVEFRKVDGPDTSDSTPGRTPPIRQLKDLSLETRLWEDSRPMAIIAAGDTPGCRRAAARLADATGLKVVDPSTIRLPLESHVIAVGARENNDLINRLYRQGFCYTDRAYPGPGGHEVRSIHNPTGGNFNVLLAGGSDDAGVANAADRLAAILGKDRVAGHLMELKVPGFPPYPFNAYDPNNYYSRMISGIPAGYGWNYVASMMALFYQTGDIRYARDFLRLAFPDQKAIADIKKFNAESIENPSEPLSGPYHYTCHQLILLWDLIEEHPFFNDETRLKITRALSRQLDHPGISQWSTRRVNPKQRITGDRHHQWGDISLYALARYFNRDYPAPVWKNSLAAAKSGFEPIHRADGWIDGESGVIGWFLSGAVNPPLQFLALAGDDRHEDDGALANSIRLFECKWDGSSRSEMLDTAARQTFYMAAEQFNDGKFLYYADLLPPWTAGRKIGPSYLPDGKIAKREPLELVGRWTAVPMTASQHDHFKVKAPLDKLNLGISWRDSLGTTGDFVSFDCFNTGSRSAFRLLSLYRFRLNGQEVLKGLGNFCQTYRNGTTEPHIPTAGQTYGFGSAGDAVYFSGGVPDQAYAHWQRDLLLRKRRFLLLADTVTPREKSPMPINCAINFQCAATITESGSPNKLRLPPGRIIPVRECRNACDGGGKISFGPNATLFETMKDGERAVIDFTLHEPFSGQMHVSMLRHNTRAAAVNFRLDGRLLRQEVPHYHDSSAFTTDLVALGKQRLAAGSHRLEIEVASRIPEIKKAWICARHLEFQPDDSQRIAFATGGAQYATTDIDCASAKRTFGGDPAQPVTTFTLIAPETDQQPIDALPVGPRAALLKLPADALAFTGQFAGVGEGTLALIDPGRAMGFGIVRLDGLLQASSPVAIDWDLATGELSVEGKPGTALDFPGGRLEVLSDATATMTAHPPSSWRADFQKRLASLKPATPASAEADDDTTARLPVKTILRLPHPADFFTPVAIRGRFHLLSGARSGLMLIDDHGRLARSYNTPSAVTAAEYFPAIDAVVAGCHNSQIIAFDRASGRELWRFTSILAPEVEATQKFYWFKDAYPGIFALTASGKWLYAGSACTMEAIDADGKLIRRYGHAWGPTRQIALLRDPVGVTNAVGLRHSSADGNYLWLVNEKTGNTFTSFKENLPGYRNFPSFGSLYRTKMAIDDFDGDGQPDLMADTQGMYLWMSVYDNSGKPKYQLNLGPGEKNMGKFILDWTTGDFTGTGRNGAILVTLARDMLALDGQLRPLWTASLPFTARFVAIQDHATAPVVAVAGGREGALYDSTGRPAARFTTPTPIAGVFALPDGRIWLASRDAIMELQQKSEDNGI